MTLLDLFKTCKLNIGDILIDRGSGELLNHEFEIQPKDFLNYSKQDFKTKDQRGHINALTNAKRAIDCQTDKILTCFGFAIDKQLPKSNHQYIQLVNAEIAGTDLPHKLKLIQAFGLAPADIIADSRMIRNKLEHYYVSCRDKDVQNAIQLADLFINATDSKLKIVWDYRITDGEGHGKDDCACIDVRFNQDKKIEVGGFHQGKYHKLEFDQNDIEFYGLLKLTYSFDYDQDLEDAFKELMRIIKHPIPEHNIYVQNI
jgi:hypothetical protein